MAIGRLLLLPLLLLAASPLGAYSASLLSMLQTAPNLTTFTHLLNVTSLGDQMSSGTCSPLRCFLVFVPTDAAFAAAYPSGVPTAMADRTNILQSLYMDTFANGKKGLLANWPIDGTRVGIDVGFGQVQILSTSSSVNSLYWLGKQNSGSDWMFHVNNAKLIMPLSNKEADNGVYHVLDRVPLPTGQGSSLKNFMTSGNAALFSKLKVTKSVQYFNKWISEDNPKAFVYNGFLETLFKVRTVFLPSDMAWDNLGTSGLQTLEASRDAKRLVLSAHFALNYTLFTGWMSEVSKIDFSAGINDTHALPATMYVNNRLQGFVSCGGVVAKFVDGSLDYPLSDAVVHVVDRPLAFLHRTLASLAQANAPAFYSSCLGVASCKAMMESSSGSYTLFAPQSVASLSGVTAARLEEILKLHFVPNRRVGRPDMTTSTTLQSSGNVGEIRFSFSENETRLWVQGRLSGGGFVMSEMVLSDEPATNGLLHRISVPLGQPDKNVQEFLSSYAKVSNFSQYLGSGDFDPNLGAAGTSITVFAPDNAAMEKLRLRTDASGQNVGQQVLANKLLRDRVFRRIILPNAMVVVSDMSAGSSQFATANTVENERVTLTVTGAPGATGRAATLSGAGVTAQVNLTDGPYQCTNGMVYTVDTPLFRDSCGATGQSTAE